jgi:hypothetical protein
MHTSTFRHFCGFFSTIRKQNLSKRLFLFLLLSTLGLMVQAQNSRLRVINMAPDFGDCDIYINDQKTAEAVMPNDKTSSIALSAGYQTIVAAPSGSTSIAEGLAIGEYMFRADQNYLLIFYAYENNGVRIPAFTLWENTDETLVNVLKIEAYLQELHPNRKS